MWESAHLVETSRQDRHLPSTLQGWPAGGRDVHRTHSLPRAWVLSARGQIPNPRTEPRDGPICPARKGNQPGVGVGWGVDVRSKVRCQFLGPPHTSLLLPLLMVCWESSPPIPPPSSCQRELLVSQVMVWTSLEGTQRSRQGVAGVSPHLAFQGLKTPIDKKASLRDLVDPPGYAFQG